MKNESKSKAIAILRIAIVAAILMVALALAMNKILVGFVVAAIAGVFLVYFLVKDRRYLR